MSFDFRYNSRIGVFDFNVENLGHANATISKKHCSSPVFPNIFTKCSQFSRGAYGYKTYYLIFRKIRKTNVFISDHWGILNIGIHKILDLTIIKKINPYNTVILILNTNYYKRVVFGIRVSQSTYVLDKLCLALFVPNVDKPFLVIKTILIIMSK